MPSYTTDIDWSEMAAKLKSLRQSGFILNMRKAILEVDVYDDKIVAKGFACIATLRKGTISCQLDVNYNWMVKFLIVFFYGFMLLFLFAQNVTINGNSNPSWLERLMFTGLFSAVGTAFFLILFGDAKNIIKKKIEHELNLTPTDTSNRS